MQLLGIECTTNVRNTGHNGSCPFNPGLVKGDILVPYDFEVAVLPTDSPAVVAAAIKAALLAAFVHNTFANRAQFIGKYVENVDKSEAANFQSFNLGTKSKVSRTRYMDEHQYTNGGQDYHNSVLTYQGKHEKYKRISVQDGGIIRGAVKYTAGLVTAFQGVELDGIDVNDMKEGELGKTPDYRITFTAADAAELNENSFVVNMNENVFDMIEDVIVTDVVMIPFTATAARVHPFMFKTVAGDVNLADTLGTILNSTTIVTAANKISGVAIAVTSCAVNTLTGKYVITFTAGAGYVAGEVAVVHFASVSALHALGADYYSAEHTVEITMA